MAFADHPLVKKHRPAGYSVLVKPLGSVNGLAVHQRDITIDSSLDERSALFVFLHEAGHVHHQHLRVKHHKAVPSWRAEYEADRYAIGAMREGGVPVPRKILALHKQNLREEIARAPDDEVVDEEVLRYAFGQEWRKHK